MAVLRVFDLGGREIARPFAGYVPAGHHETTWDGRDASGREVAAGTYFYRLDARGGSLTRKLVVL
jgi:flagellar hook assembly protein FlgD